MDYNLEWFMDASAWILPVLLAVTMHEAAHGWMALKFGDDTAKRLGRVTFNPLRHVDPIGTVVFPGFLMLLQSKFLFGYAKPVPVHFSQLHPQRLGIIMVALAGPMANILLALVSGLLLHVDMFVTPEQMPWLYQNLYRSLSINCILAVFNLIPLLPLDGGRVVYAVLPVRMQRIYGSMERSGIFLVLAILFVPLFFGYEEILELVSLPTYWLLENIVWLTGNGS